MCAAGRSLQDAVDAAWNVACDRAPTHTLTMRNRAGGRSTYLLCTPHFMLVTTQDSDPAAEQ